MIVTLWADERDGERRLFVNDKPFASDLCCTSKRKWEVLSKSEVNALPDIEYMEKSSHWNEIETNMSQEELYQWKYGSATTYGSDWPNPRYTQGRSRTDGQNGQMDSYFFQLGSSPWL